MTRYAQLRKFIAQRSGFDIRDYARDWTDRDGIAAFRADYREFQRAGRDAREMLRFCERFNVSLDDARNGNGRLCWDDAGTLDYCTGQYFSVEFRPAACNLLASAIARHWNCETRAETVNAARRWFGRGIVNRWFK